MQAIDSLHDILRQIARRPLNSGHYEDAAGTVRLVVPTLTWNGFVHLAFDEIRQVGAGSPQVSRRLRAALEDLLSVASPDQKPALAHQLSQLSQLVSATASSETDRDAASMPDTSGIGSAATLVTPSRLGTTASATR